MRLVDIASRWLFGGFYALVGLWALVATFLGLQPPSQATRAAQDFTNALTATRFIDPLLGISYLVGGGALFLSRTAPLGVVVLAPSVIVIFFFHLLLSGQWAWGAINLAWLAALAWQLRYRLTSLWHVNQASPHSTGA